ncbi:hypothetical protein BDA96_01G152000 [Sorghum bicolor]|uniref:Uncharacterized protein n=2 Tax=Sorghum bicolor TaxID=4558 RepID=A0A921RYS5_SORBI|nr:hypothetical protein BDA96_01G152000 [Sorghum bicolor]OQU91233.1 hypothetical protein SORBI_3001G145050 [Sorghum bicolor]
MTSGGVLVREPRHRPAVCSPDGPIHIRRHTAVRRPPTTTPPSASEGAPPSARHHATVRSQRLAPVRCRAAVSSAPPAAAAPSTSVATPPPAHHHAAIRPLSVQLLFRSSEVSLRILYFSLIKLGLGPFHHEGTREGKARNKRQALRRPPRSPHRFPPTSQHQTPRPSPDSEERSWPGAGPPAVCLYLSCSDP